MKLFVDGSKSQIKNIIFILLGTLVLSFGTAVFIVPFELVSGGVSGLSVLVSHALWGVVSFDLLLCFFNWTLFFVGAVVFGKEFASKTLLSSIVYPIGVAVFGKLAERDVFGLTNGNYPQLALLLAAVFGGAFVGVGCALTFLGGGSTGGADVIAFVTCKYVKRLKSSTAIFIVDAAIVLLGIFVIKDVVLSMLGILTALVSSVAVDKIFIGTTDALSAQIVSDEYQKISSEIIEQLGRTVTVIDAVGGYSGKSKKMLLVSFSRQQYVKLLEIVSRIDKTAFVTVHRVYEVGGKGWKSF